MAEVLILGGTAEAAALAEALQAWPRLSVTTALAGRTREPATPAGAVRIGGFGGPEGLAAYLRETEVAALIDATHPFAATISRNAVAAAAAAGAPRLRLQRPAWRPGEDDRWTEVPDLATAAAAIPAGARVLLATGRQELAPFAGRADVHFLVRLVDPPDTPLPLPDHDLLVQRGPFEAAAETRLLQEAAIDLVVCKNSGGAASFAKLAAARALGLPVLLVARPPAPPGPTVESVDGALAWLRTLLPAR